MLLTNILEQSTQQFAHRPALTMRMGYRTKTLSYADVYDLSKKIAIFLQQQGLRKGDCVIVLAPNSPYWVCLFWGCLLSGVVIVPITIQSTPEMVQRFASHTDAKLFFKYRTCHYQLINVRSYDIEVIDELVASYSLEDFSPVDIAQDDLVQILFTSGTTGDPKGTMLTHKNMVSNVTAVSRLFSLTNDQERFLSILPLSHIYEQSFGLILPYTVGAQIIYAHSSAAIRDLMQKYRITKMLAVPEFLKLFMEKIEATAEENGRLPMLKRMRRISQSIGWQWFSRLLFHSVLKQFGGKLDVIASGGAPLDPLLELKWEMFGITILQGYGLTETSPIVTTNTFADRRLGSVGKVVPGVEVKLADDGEIFVKGPSVFKGYLKSPQKTSESFTDDGWFKTGDIGSFDEEGFLFLRGRKKYMILSPGGQNVYPDDIEQELNEIAGVQDSCVIGLEQPGGNVQIHAVLLLKNPTIDPTKIVMQANEKLATYQRINTWAIWPDTDFPRSATRKIKKHEVAKIIQEQQLGIIRTNRCENTPLIKILAQISNKDHTTILPETKIVQDLSLDSLSLVEMIMRIEERYEVSIDETKITVETTVVEIEQLIKAAKSLAKPIPVKRWPRTWWVKGFRFLGQQLLFTLTRLFVRYEIKGLENLKDLSSPVVFMPNHTSYFDGIAMTKALPQNFRSNLAFAAARDVLYEEFKSFALIAEFLFAAFPFPRREQENIRQGLDAMGQLLDEECNVVIFPEGFISKDGALQKLKKGAGLIAVEMGVLVVPVFIKGADDIFPYDTLKPCTRGKITIIFGKPMKFSKLTSYDEATENIEFALRALVDQ